jgi:alpha-mannosidase
MLSPQTKPILYIIVNNHFDLTWRRCWQRPFTFQGQTYVSYTDLQAYYMLDNIELALRHPEYKFEAESTQVVRKFIERCPEKLPILRRLQAEGRFAITGGGEAIVDANMITGESLARNYVDGLLWVEETFGQKTRLAVRNDAFGNSAQLPQILRGCEIDWATGMSYSSADNLYWRGLDGSTILVETLPILVRGGGVNKYRPCAACNGTGLIDSAGCPTCRGRGIDPTLRAGLPGPFNPNELAGFGAGIIWMPPEELLPNPALLEWAEQQSAEYDVRFALEEEVLPHLRPWLEEVDRPAPDCLHSSLELNPNNSGCLVTRIQTKQAVRRQEYALQAAETLSVLAALKGAAYPATYPAAFPREALKQARQQQYFTMFHDAITATHIDAAYTELCDIYQDIDRRAAAIQAGALSALYCPAPAAGIFSVINPTGSPLTARCTAQVPATQAPVFPAALSLADEQGQPVALIDAQPSGDGQVQIEFLASGVPAFSARQYRVMPGSKAIQATPLAEPVIENSRFRVLADEHGLTSVFDKSLGREILVSGEYRPGELILEHDEGSPWATLNPDQHRIALAQHTRLVSASQGSASQALVFAIETPREMGLSGKCLRARVTVTLTEGLEQVDFAVHADWSAFNYRLRAAMPVPKVGPCQHMYEIPYGMLSRAPYEPTFRWAGANGDWPAVNWAGVEQPGLSVALLNQGTPAYCIEASPNHPVETILLSLLRSPAIPAYLHEPEFYTMTDWNGMRDEGEHDFAYAIRAYPVPFAESSVVLDADGYNAQPIVVDGAVELPPMPQVQSAVARVSAVKWGEDGQGLVLRLVEFRGQGGPVEVHLPPAARAAAKVNLLERQAEALEIREQVVSMVLKPWEIATIKIWL